MALAKGGQNNCLKYYRVLTIVDAVIQAECTLEPLKPISTAGESNILYSDEIDAIEKITVGQA